METELIGRVCVAATIANYFDCHIVDIGVSPEKAIRSVTVPDAVVDTRVLLLALPSSTIAQLGLRKESVQRVRTPSGVCDTNVYSPARISVQGRDADVQVLEIPDGSPVLIGRIPLIILDFVVDPRGQRLIGNPEHGGEQMYDMF